MPGSTLRYTGAADFRQRLLLATLTGRAVRIDDSLSAVGGVGVGSGGALRAEPWTLGPRERISMVLGGPDDAPLRAPLPPSTPPPDASA